MSISSVGGFIQSKLQASFKRNSKKNTKNTAAEKDVVVVVVEEEKRAEMKYLELIKQKNKKSL